MGRIISVHPGGPTPAQDTNLSFKMIKLAEPEKEIGEIPCIFNVEGLFWQELVEGAFYYYHDEKWTLIPISEVHNAVNIAQYTKGLYPPQDPSTTLCVAQLMGELCDREVTWEFDWISNDGMETTRPDVLTFDSYCVIHSLPIVVYPFEEGTLTFTASVGGIQYGPLSFTYWIPPPL